ncbi:hypothetical protein [Actinoplanes couchii]|uniref:Integral membrane protein n=1 Tax=Actinoplanes couchii TaxID=403638 RepID=A0ABQ3XRB2_9ACTN|nr:hypothetical protein [Actinoplanes couchii]MDR6318216.1 hypothetical protein [Actinoplanes couchii]GID61010.1 hypothetical protein Aco03nite_094140 [Actinoplanes couchii]
MPSLYVAHDDRMVIVSRLPLKIAGGSGYSYSWGDVLELTPADQGVRRGPWVGFLYILRAVIGIFIASNLIGLVSSNDVLPALAVAAGVTLAVLGWRRKPGVIEAPHLGTDRAEHHVLVEDQDRMVFSDAIDLCRRTSETWPALGDLIDVPTAKRQLAQALFDIAGVLERRQELRELHDELAEHAGAPELAPRLAKATEALVDVDDELTRRLATLNAVAVTGEQLIHDERIGALAREADEVLTRLASPPPAAVPDAASELAERTEAVLRAYRELTDRAPADRGARGD